MDILISFVLLSSFLIIVISFFHIKIAISLYIIYIVCVPYQNVQVLGLNMGDDMISISLFLAFFLNCLKQKRSFSFHMLRAFIPFFLLTGLMILIQDRTPMEYQLRFWKYEMFQTLLIPATICSIFKYDYTIINYLKWGLVVAMLISGIYAVFLMFMPPGLNPYLMIMSSINQVEYNMDYANDAHRALPRIFSTFSHPLRWCYFLTLFLLTFTFFKGKISSWLFYGIILLAIFDLIFCGVRTGMVAILVPITYILFKLRRFKYVIYASICLLTGLILLFTLADKDVMSDYFMSLVDNSQTSTKGSDLDMRLYQWEGCMDECRGRELIGNGYRFTTYYEIKKGDHPKAVTFESLIFIIYTNWGILGFLIWGLLFLLIMRTNELVTNPINRIYLNALLLHYIVFTTLTGEYQFLRWFALFYVILYTILKSNERSSNNRLLSATVPSIQRK